MNKVYLDQRPEIDKIVKEFMTTLPIGEDSKLDALECRSRDGFIPHSHNHGGYDVSCLVPLAFYHDLPTAIYDEARAVAIDNQRLAEESEGFSELTEEEQDDLIREFQTEAVRWGVRAMYEGVDADGNHILMIYVCVNISEYYSFCGNGSTDLAEYTIEFNTPAELSTKLAELESTIISVLEGK